jgi:hypothetical protein
MNENLVTLTVIAATLPLVISFFVALSPSARVESITGYFLYGRNLDIDGFVKTTIGYSLQVASIYLLLYWTIAHGIRVVFVPVAWGIGFWLISRAILSKKFESFLTQNDNPPTIHGFIASRMPTSVSIRSRTFCASVLALATIIGLGGSMMSEVDYATKYIIQSLDVQSTSPIVELIFHGTLLGFTVIYVLWGGYRCVVATEKIQVPLAYFGFGVFTAFVAVLAPANPSSRLLVQTLLVMCGLIYLTILIFRRRTLKNSQPGEELNTLAIMGSLSLLFIAVFLWSLSDGVNKRWLRLFEQ